MGQQLGDQLVYVIDDDREIRLSLSFQLRTLGYAVFPFADAPAFLDAAGSLAPGCVLLDVRMPNMDGAQALVAMRRRGVTWPVVIMTGHAEVSIAVDVMKNGALDFLEKPFEDAELQAALRRGFERLDEQRVQSEASRHAADRLGRLTRREHDVLHLMLAGESNKAIAFKLDLSVRTVEMHRANALAKLEARNAAEAAAVVAAAPRSSRS